MKKFNFQKYAVAFVALIFLGSMAGALLYSTGNENTTTELPKEIVLTQMSEDQKQLALSKGYVILEAAVPATCYLDCAAQKRGLEQAISALNPAAYLVEMASQSVNMDIPVSMSSYKDKKTLAAFNQTEIENFVCDNSPFRPAECVIRNMNLGGRGNSGANETQETNGNRTAAQQNASLHNGTNVPANSSATGGNLNGTNASSSQ